jgi:hypothetical protein
MAAVLALRSKGLVAPTSTVQLLLLIAGAGLALAAGFSTITTPIAVLVAKGLGIPFSARETIAAATILLIALVNCLVLAAAALGAIRRMFTTEAATVLGQSSTLR